jgi:hypothetical protein
VIPIEVGSSVFETMGLSEALLDKVVRALLESEIIKKLDEGRNFQAQMNSHELGEVYTHHLVKRGNLVLDCKSIGPFIMQARVGMPGNMFQAFNWHFLIIGMLGRYV